MDANGRRPASHLCKTLSRCRRYAFPRLSDPDLDPRHADEKKTRIQPVMLTLSLCYLVIVLGWFVMPSDGQATSVWLFYRSNNVLNVLALLSLVLAHRCRPRWFRFASFDFHLCIVGTHFFVFQCFTRSHAEQLLGLQVGPPAHDEAYQLIMCLTWWTAVISQAELDIRYQIIMLHVNIIVWVGLSVYFGTPSSTSGLFLKQSVSYYCIVGMIIDMNRRSEHRRCEMLVLQHRLEQQVDQERRLARYEREAALEKVSAAEQAALRSFMAAVFDIFGHLEWIRMGVDEPQLCFGATQQLNALMKQDLSGKPLDALLGKAPPHGEGRERWHHERQRLWNYVAVEAAVQSDEGEGGKVQKVARKIALTCVDATGSTFEAELFMCPGSGDRTLFGLLVLTRGEEIKSACESSLGLAASEVCLFKAGCDASAAESRASSEDSPGPDNAQVFAWVDAYDSALPIVVCSATFARLSKPGDGESLKLMDMVINGESFQHWFQRCSSSWVHEENQMANPSFLHWVHLRPAASFRSFVEVKSLVRFASADLYEFERESAGKYKQMRVPVKLVFMGLRMKGQPTVVGKRSLPDTRRKVTHAL